MTGQFALEDILKPHPLEERVYRLRCVEAWSMVVPWIGFPLGDLLKRFKPTSKAKYVEFKTLYDPEQMPGQRRSRARPGPTSRACASTRPCIRSTLMVVGLYGKVLPNQNGAPLRLVVPWKYGFKGIKAIVSIKFVERMPAHHLGGLGPHRVRLLRQRQSGRRSSALEPGHRAAHRRRASSPRAGPPCRSTATPTRWPRLYSGMDLRRYF